MTVTVICVNFIHLTSFCEEHVSSKCTRTTFSFLKPWPLPLADYQHNPREEMVRRAVSRYPVVYVSNVHGRMKSFGVTSSPLPRHG